MNKLLLISTFCIATGLFAQITVTSSDMVSGPDTVIISNANDPSIDFVTTGANQTWDFSYLTAVSQDSVIDYELQSSFLMNLNYGIFAPAKYQASYYKPATNLPLDQVSGFLPISIGNPLAFYKINTDSMAMVGYTLTIEGIDIAFRSDTIEAYYRFPLNFGDSYVTRGYTNVDFNPYYNGAWIQKRVRTSQVDGWGSITTPYGMFDAIRVKHTIDETDSLFVDFGVISQWVELPIPETSIYEWWTNNEKEPILRISTRSITGQDLVTGIEYKDNFLNLASVKENEDINVNIYPIPSDDQITVTGVKSSDVYVIYDESGKNIASGVFYSSSIDISDYSAGTYILIIKNEQGLASRSFIKR